MFQPQENLHCMSATNPSNFVYIPVPVPVPVYVHPQHYPIQTPNFYPQTLSFEMNKQGCFMPPFQAPHYDEPTVVNTEWTLVQERTRTITQNPNHGGRQTSFNELLEPVDLTESESSPEPVSPPEVLAETEQTLMRIRDSNNGGQENVSPPEIMFPFEPVSLPWSMSPFKPVPSPWTTFPYEHVSSPWAAFPFEPVPPFKHVPPPNAFITTEQKLVQLFIGGLDFSIDKQQLFKEFLPFGDLISAKVIMKNGRSKGYGFVVYSNHVDAETAIKNMNGRVLGKKQLVVVLSKRKESGRTHQAETEQKIWSDLGTKEQTQIK